MKYAALDVAASAGELALAVADDFSPTAAEEHDGILTIYFVDRMLRDGAIDAIAGRLPDAAARPREVDDQDWARRSQQHLKPITVGRVTIVPPWFADADPQASLSAFTSQPSALRVIIQPSTGFGTGHHATTRLCLQGLQTLDLLGASILDVGTGSGVLALAARKLGAHRALGVDIDPDAVRAATDNLPLNAEIDNVTFQVSDFTTSSLAPADVVTANLTGALLCRASADLMNVVRPGGVLIVSGLQAHERDEVVAAFHALSVEWECEDEGWVGLVFRRQA